MADSSGVFRCPICRQLTLVMGAPGPGMPSITVDGIHRVLKPVYCQTCTVVFFVFGEADQIDWNAVNAAAEQYERSRGRPEWTIDDSPERPTS